MNRILTIERWRLAAFTDALLRNYNIVVRGDDIERAPHWGGFVGWLFGEHPEEVRDLRGHKFDHLFNDKGERRAR